MSIVRIGLSERKGFSEGYEAIFGNKKKEKKETPAKAKAEGEEKKKKGKKK